MTITSYLFSLKYIFINHGWLISLSILEFIQNSWILQDQSGPKENLLTMHYSLNTICICITFFFNTRKRMIYWSRHFSSDNIHLNLKVQVQVLDDEDFWWFLQDAEVEREPGYQRILSRASWFLFYILSFIIINYSKKKQKKNCVLDLNFKKCGCEPDSLG